MSENPQKQITMDEIDALWSADAQYDRNDLAVVSCTTPQLHAKYLKIHGVERRRLSALKFQYKSLRLDKTKYFQGKMTKEELDEKGWAQFDLKVLRQDVDKYLEADGEIQRIAVKIETTENLLEHLEYILKQIDKRDYQIKNAISFLNFTHGNQY